VRTSAAGGLTALAGVLTSQRQFEMHPYILFTRLKHYFCINKNTMAVSSIDKELIRYFIQLDEPQKKSLLEMMKTFLRPGNEPVETITIEQYNKELNEAMERINNGAFTTLEELEK
jgi:hypothetical protein